MSERIIKMYTICGVNKKTGEEEIYDGGTMTSGKFDNRDYLSKPYLTTELKSIKAVLTRALKGDFYYLKPNDYSNLRIVEVEVKIKL